MLDAGQRPLSERIRPTEHLPPRVQQFQLLNREDFRLQHVGECSTFRVGRT
jgi:hypothetical protein